MSQARPTIQQHQPGAYRLGVLLVALSAVAWSTAGLFTKSVSADVWAILFWRGVFSTFFVFIYVYWIERGRTLAAFTGLGWPGWLIATTGSVATLAFIASFKFTAVANVVIIYATAPFVAAALAWWWMRERAGTGTLWAAGAALLGVAVMVGGSAGTPNLLGDILALVMTFFMALMMVLMRRFPEAPAVVAAGCLSSLQLLILGGLLSDPFAIPPGEIASLASFGLVQAAGIILLTEGTRLIPAAQAALLGALEVPLAPIWAWLLLSEIPAVATAIGGVPSYWPPLPGI